MRLLLVICAALAAATFVPSHQHGHKRYHLKRDSMPAIKSKNSEKTQATDGKTSRAETTQKSETQKSDTQSQALKTDSEKASSATSSGSKSTETKSTGSSSKADPKPTISSSKDPKPTLSLLPTVSTTSTASASPTYTFSVTVPLEKNPFVHRTHLPTGLVFIVVGALIGAALVAFVGYYTIVWLISRSLAESDREVYFGNPSHVAFGHSRSSSINTQTMLLNGSELLFMEKSSASWGSNSLIYMLQRQSSLARFDQMVATNPNWETTQQGRLYRDMKGENRQSMYISPVLEMMKLKLNVDLPYLYDSPMTESPDIPLDYVGEPERPTRPPSQYLDDLLGASDSSISSGNEKV